MSVGQFCATFQAASTRHTTMLEGEQAERVREMLRWEAAPQGLVYSKI